MIDLNTSLFLLSNDVHISFVLRLTPRKRQLNMFLQNTPLPLNLTHFRKPIVKVWVIVRCCLSDSKRETLALLCTPGIAASIIGGEKHFLILYIEGLPPPDWSCDIIISNKQLSNAYTKLGRASHPNLPSRVSVSVRTLALCESSPETTFSTDFRENHLRVNRPSVGEALAAGLFHKGV